MQGALAELLHDAASIYRLVEFIERFCVDQKSAQSYASATHIFFETVTDLADKTKQHLVRTAAEATDRAQRGYTWESNVWFRNQRDSILTIKGDWTIIHKYLKPAADAHALKVPMPLVELAERQLESVQGMVGAKIAVLLTPELNYFQTSTTQLRTATDALRKTIKADATSQTTDRIGFVELPYSQGSTLFTNIAIYHELGHFTLEVYPKDPLAEAAERSLKDVYGARYTRLSKDRRAGAKVLLRKWAEEVFCDLFAIRLIGPAFSFASIEMFSLIGLLLEENKRKFLPSHPAPACRFGEQLKLLRDDKWWEVVGGLDAEQRRLIEELGAIPDSEFAFYLDRKTKARDQRAVQAFRSLLPTVRELANELTSEPTEVRQYFVSQRAEIEKCFSHGVVPSRLLLDGQLIPGHPVAVVNSAFCSYLTELPSFINRLEKDGANKIDQRSLWTRRLEMWTIKAIEDFFIIDGVRSHGSSSTKRNTG